MSIARKIAGPYLDRVVVERETKKLVEQLDTRSASVAEISGDRWRDFGFAQYRSLDYPAFDLAAPLTLQERFDLIIAEQVFEHIAFPYRAGKNVYAMLNPGGHFLVATPFLQRVHNYPIDCSRWTETGLKYLLVECGFAEDGIVTGSWGNRNAARANMRSRTRFPHYNTFFFSMKNDPMFPLQVWALAKK
jgi:SAM-dependent methyltransferase